MYNFYSDSEDLFKNAVTAEDVLKIYRNINNINLCDENVVALENKLLINSFCRNHFLYSNKFLYYKLSITRLKQRLFVIIRLCAPTEANNVPKT